MSCNIDSMTNIGTEFVGVLVDKALLVDDKRTHCLDAYVHGLKYAETRQRRREENIFRLLRGFRLAWFEVTVEVTST